MAKEFVTLLMGEVSFNGVFNPGDNTVEARKWNIYHGSAKKPTAEGAYEDFLYDPIADRTFRLTYSYNGRHLPPELNIRFGRTEMQNVGAISSAFDHSVITRDVAGEDIPALVFIINNPTDAPIQVDLTGWQKKLEDCYILVEEMVTIETPDDGLL